jgi:hypothetical protein
MGLYPQPDGSTSTYVNVSIRISALVQIETHRASPLRVPTQLHPQYASSTASYSHSNSPPLSNPPLLPPLAHHSLRVQSILELQLLLVRHNRRFIRICLTPSGVTSGSTTPTAAPAGASTRTGTSGGTTSSPRPTTSGGVVNRVAPLAVLLTMLAIVSAGFMI